MEELEKELKQANESIDGLLETIKEKNEEIIELRGAISEIESIARKI